MTCQNPRHVLLACPRTTHPRLHACRGLATLSAATPANPAPASWVSQLRFTPGSRRLPLLLRKERAESTVNNSRENRNDLKVSWNQVLATNTHLTLPISKGRRFVRSPVQTDQPHACIWPHHCASLTWAAMQMCKQGRRTLVRERYRRGAPRSSWLSPSSGRVLISILTAWGEETPR